MRVSTVTDDDIYTLIVAKSTLVNQEDNVDYSRILEKILFYEKSNPTLLLLDWYQYSLQIFIKLH